MAMEIAEYISVRDRLAELGCLAPARIAILPVNFDSAVSRADFLQRSEAATVRTLLRTNGIPIDELLHEGENSPYIQNNAF